MHDIISQFSELQTQYKNNHFLADIKTYDGKEDRFFLRQDHPSQKITMLMQHPKVQLSQAKAEDIVYKLLDNMPPSST